MLIPLALLFACSVQRAFAVTCYSHDGVSAADSPISANTTAKVLYACNPNAQYSTCCKAGETCGTDLLCHNADGVKVARQYCTDKTWQTDQCSRLCPEYDEAGTVLTTCNDGTYCCGAQNYECCDKGAGYRINPRNGQIVIQSRSSSASSSTSTSSSSTSTSASSTAATTTPSTTNPASQPVSTNPAPLPSPAATSSSSSTLSSGAKAGIAIGAIAGVALIAALGFLIYRERRKRNNGLKRQQQSMGGAGYDAWQSVPSHEMQQQPPPPSEMGAYERNEGKYHFRGELGEAQGKPAELRG